MTQDETATIIKKVHDLYFHQDRYVTSDIINSRVNYWDIYFKDFSFAVVNRVVDTWAKSHRDMPTPSDLLPLCKDERHMEWARAQNIHAENIKSTADLIWEARNGPIENIEITPEIRAMTDAFIEAFKKRNGDDSVGDQGDLANSLPYEV